ncbi:MAG: hypothetical protein QOH74_1330 [Gaiellales bacterium]|jgi:hypothetical protein|nr:hypothetical protein [Gaiellales bacterium]
MLLFRSEGDVVDWCQAHNRAPGEIMPIGSLDRLASRWYGDRLDPAWRPRTRAESQAILDATGLSGAFWELP